MNTQVGLITNSPITAGVVANGAGNQIRIGPSNHYYGGGGGGRNGKPTDPTGLLFGFGVALMFVLATTAWWFAKHAALFYPVATSLAVGESLLGLTFLSLNLYQYRNGTMVFRDTVAVIVATSVAVALYVSAGAYPDELTQIAAKSTTALGFWCGLNPYGHQVATHQLSVALLAALGVLLLVPHVMAGIADTVWESGTVKDVLRRMAAPGWLVVATFVAVGAWVLIGLGPQALANLDVPFMCPPHG